MKYTLTRSKNTEALIRCHCFCRRFWPSEFLLHHKTPEWNKEHLKITYS